MIKKCVFNQFINLSYHIFVSDLFISHKLLSPDFMLCEISVALTFNNHQVYIIHVSFQLDIWTTEMI